MSRSPVTNASETRIRETRATARGCRNGLPDPCGAAGIMVFLFLLIF
jgi:hypothetical protein